MIAGAVRTDANKRLARILIAGFKHASSHGKTVKTIKGPVVGRAQEPVVKTRHSMGESFFNGFGTEKNFELIG